MRDTQEPANRKSISSRQKEIDYLREETQKPYKNPNN